MFNFNFFNLPALTVYVCVMQVWSDKCSVLCLLIVITKASCRLIWLYRAFHQAPQRDTRWSAGTSFFRGKKKPGPYFQTIFINSSSDRKSIPVACNYSHADSVKKLLFYFSSRPWKSWGGPYLTAGFMGQCKLFLTEACQHSDISTSPNT